MNAERWRQIEELYHSAREREPGERSAFLAEACRGDEELRHKVKLPLAQDVSNDDAVGEKILDRPAWELSRCRASRRAQSAANCCLPPAAPAGAAHAPASGDAAAPSPRSAG